MNNGETVIVYSVVQPSLYGIVTLFVLKSVVLMYETTIVFAPIKVQMTLGKYMHLTHFFHLTASRLVFPQC